MEIYHKGHKESSTTKEANYKSNDPENKSDK